MASSHCTLKDLELKKTGPSTGAGFSTIKLSRGISISVRDAGWRELIRVELAVFLLLTLLFLATYLLSMAGDVNLFGFDLTVLIFCPVLALTGIPCLMCGITRSFLAMSGLDITGAFIFHPLGPFFIIMLVFLFFASAYSIVARKQLRLTLSSKMKRRLIRFGTLIILAAWLVKVVIWYQVGLL